MTQKRRSGKARVQSDTAHLGVLAWAKYGCYIFLQQKYGFAITLIKFLGQSHWYLSYMHGKKSHMLKIILTLI